MVGTIVRYRQPAPDGPFDEAPPELADVFQTPTRPDVNWSRVETLVRALGGSAEQRAGSRVVLKLNGVRAVLHSPHPSPDTTRATRARRCRLPHRSGRDPAGPMTYRGYTAAVAFDADDRMFSGRIVDLRDVIHFEGTSVKELETAMRDTVDDYLAYCSENGEEPDRPYSGKVGLRLDSDLHRAAAARAAQEGKSLNDLIVETLSDRLGRPTMYRAA